MFSGLLLSEKKYGEIFCIKDVNKVYRKSTVQGLVNG